jgi:LysM repeat protein
VTRLRILIVLLVSFLLLTSSTQAQADPASQLIQLVNQLRIAYGQAPFQVDPILMSVAQTHASWSAANNVNSHLGPGGGNPDQRAKAAGYGSGYNAFVIENTASGTLELHTPELVVSMWQDDYVHLNAMISPDYEHIGVGYAEGYGMSWFIMEVGWIEDGSPARTTAETNPSEGQVIYSPFTISTPVETGALYHEVQPGQAAWTIAVYYEIELAELLALNNLTESSFLHPGDLLLIHTAPTSTSTIEPTFEPPTTTATAIPEPPAPTDEVPSTGMDLPEITPILQVPKPSVNWQSMRLISLGIGVGLVLLVIFLITMRLRKP